jgi:hypothetical protein
MRLDAPLASESARIAPPALAAVPAGAASEAEFGAPAPPLSVREVAVARQTAQVEPVFNAFTRWSARWQAASPEERPALLPEGLAIAQARRPLMLMLIENEPRQAIARALPMVVRQGLPAEVVALLEERINEKGFYGVIGVLNGSGRPIEREAVMSDGRRYEAFVYGSRERQVTTPESNFNGIALDKKLALDDRRARVLEAGERVPAGKSVVTTCPVSGKVTSVETNDGVSTITTATPAVEIGGTIHYLCSGGHIAAVEENLAQEGAQGGAIKPTGITSTYNTGPKTHLYMRVTFIDQLADPQSEKDSYDMMRQVNDFMLENSYGKCYFLTTVTPLLVLPRTEAWYTNVNTGSAYEVLNDARVAAKQAGFDPAAYDFDTVRYNGPGGFSGQAYVGGKGCWLKSSSVGVASHEYGHNLGLWHANFWNTNPLSVIGPGQNLEYGNTFDTMGSAGAGNQHYGAYEKNLLNWMTPELVTTVRQSGTYRIFTHDQPIADQTRRYGMKIVKDTDRTYWCELRQKFSTLPWSMSGLQITWDPWGWSNAAATNGSSSGAQLLDMTPGSPDLRNDAPLVVGRTFSDFEAGIHITPIAKLATVPVSMDVVVNLGTFPGNQAPTLSFPDQTVTAAVGAPLTFSVNASDPDGDTLAYAWDFGDRTFSTTSAASVTKSWAAAGRYTVRCTASDMKGKVATQFVVATIGSPTTLAVSGTVTGAGGVPLEGVLVHNGLATTFFRGAYTDSSGNYTITNIDPGSYTFGAILAGSTLTAAFANPVALSSDLAGLNFTAADLPTISITALDPYAKENSSDTGTFRITRTGPLTAALAVRVIYPSGTATKGNDYSLAPDVTYNGSIAQYELSIPANQASLDVVVTPINDATQEGPETVVLQMIPQPGLTIVGPEFATITIDDDDTVLPRVSIVANDEFADEGGDPAQITVARTGPTDAPLTVALTISGVAINGTDYQTVPPTVTIPAGAASAVINIVPIDDTLIEGPESGTVQIATSPDYVRDNITTATFTISDNDLNTVTIVATDASATEAGDTGTFTFTRTGDLTNALTVEYTESGTAIHGVDYVRLPGAVTIPAGQATATVTIVPLEDNIGEPSQTVIMQIRSKTTYLVGTPFSATVTITDNDLSTLTVTTLDGVATEPASGTGTDNGTFRIYRWGPNVALTVNYTISGTATPGVDYTALSGSVTFATSDTFKDVNVVALADGLFEDTETVVLTLSPSASYTLEAEKSATVQIIDYNQPNVSVSAENTTATEASGTLRFFVSRVLAPASALTVNYTMSGTATSGVDYTGATGSVVIPSGAFGAYVTLSLVNDTLVEGTETITLNLTPNPGTYGLRVPSAMYVVSDNDNTGLPLVGFVTPTSDGGEDQATVRVPVTLSAPSATPVTVNYVMNGGSASANGVDYNSFGGVLTFAPGETMQEIVLTVRDDNLPEPNETISIALTTPIGAALGQSSHTYTIIDNDVTTLTVGFTKVTSSSVESVASPQTIVVRLSAPAPAGGVTVNYAVTGGTASSPADYSLPSGVLTFAQGETTKVVPISVVLDAVAEPSNETVFITLSSPVGAALAENPTHVFTILDDPKISIAAGPVTPAEGGAPGVFTITRSGQLLSAFTVNVDFSGSAVNGSDYLTIPGTTVTFAAGQLTRDIPITPIDDQLIEGTETVTVTLLAGAGYIVNTPASATLNILDNDHNVAPSFTKGATVTVLEDCGPQSIPAWATNISAGPASEAGQMLTFTVTADAPSLFSTQPALASNGTLTFTPAPDANGSTTVTVVLKDNGGTANGGADTSAPQTFTLNVTAVNDAPTLAPLQNVTLLEDAGPLQIPLDGISTGAANEFQTLTVTATVDTPGLLANPLVTYTSPNATGILTLQPLPNVFGTVTIRVTVDDGSAQNGTTQRTFTATVAPVNDAPSFMKGADQTVLEDAGPQSVPGWATAISLGEGDVGQTGVFQVSTNNPALFAAAPALSPTGTLTYQTAPDANGSAIVTVSLRDDGGTVDGGLDTSDAQTFQITVKPVNDAPTFTKGADVNVLEDAGPQTFAGWAANRSAGPADEAGQGMSFVVSNDNPTLFLAAPSIATDGTLRFTPAADASGAATVSVRIHDTGGTDDGGVDTSAAQTFVIRVTPVNDPPTLDALNNATLVEDAGVQTIGLTGISAGPGETQTLTVTATSNNPALITGLAVVYTSPATTGTLTFRPGVDLTGTAVVQVTVNDGAEENATVVRAFTVTVNTRNDAPSFVKGANVSVLEDAGPQVIPDWATGISAGPPDEAGQALSFEVHTDNPALFAAIPGITESGALAFTPAQNAHGSATMTVVLHDDGGTADGGEDTSAAQTFTIDVTPVNDAPSFVKGGDVQIKQNAGVQTLPQWATALSAGPDDESGQALDFVVTNDNPTLFIAPPAIAPNGTLSFTPAAHANGFATVTVRLHDSGGTTDGGLDLSVPQTFLIGSSAVNDAPSFTAGPAQSVAQVAGAQMVAGWATNIAAGPADEAGQHVHFEVVADKPELFATAPAISPEGTLTFAPKPDASGTAKVTVVLRDDGGTLDGGVDASAPQTFTIAVTTFIEEAGAYNGLITAAAGQTPTNEMAGLVHVQVLRTGAFTAVLRQAGRLFIARGNFDKGGVATFGKTKLPAFVLKRTGLPDLQLQLQLDVGAGTDKLRGTITQDGQPFATVESDRALYSSARVLPAGYQRVEEALLGRYTVAFAPPAVSSLADTTAMRGCGFGTVTITKLGTARLTGTLADGTMISYGNALSKAAAWPLYVPVTRGRGSMSGWISFPKTDGDAPASPGLMWFKPPAVSRFATLYPSGWPDGMQVDLTGSKYVMPKRLENRSVLPGLGMADAAAGNAEAEFLGSGLPAEGLKAPLNILANNLVTPIVPNSDRLSMRLVASTGTFSGSFSPAAGGGRSAFKGVVLQKQQCAVGYFLRNGASGSIEVLPKAGVQ